MADTATWLTDALNTSPSSNMSTPSSVSSGGAFDWLNGLVKNVGTTAATVYSAKASIEAAKKQDVTQQTYQNAQQTPVQSSNIIKNVDNNYLLLGIVGVIGVIMFIKG